MANEITVPLLPCRDVDEIVEFHGILGFTKTYYQQLPNPYVALKREDIQLHFFGIKDFKREDSYGSCLVIVRDTGALYRAFADGMRAARGKWRPDHARLGLSGDAILGPMPVRTVIEHGPKDKRTVAFGVDWPGWSRGAKSAELALEMLESYRQRYRPIANLAGLAREFDAAGALEIVEEKVGTGSTDFWGISFSPSATEQGPMAEDELERAITLLRACWAFFDGVAARVSPEMRKGPRGGGRDRDRIVRHAIRTESEDFAKRVGLRIPEEGALTPEGLREYREAYVAAMRAYNAGEVGRPMRSWTLPFLIRHSAYHTLDHAWEMEDKDLS